MLRVPAVEGAPGGSLVPLGFQEVPVGTCTVGADNPDCLSPYKECVDTRKACVCKPGALVGTNQLPGADTCYGFCELTPCGRCNKCVSDVRAFHTERVLAMTGPTAVANEWNTFCTDTLKRSAADCKNVTDRIRASPNGDVGKRAGKICELLSDCTGLPPDCKLETSAEPAGSPLDLCTVDGVSTGQHVTDVQSSNQAFFKLPPGSCLNDNHCTGQVCDLQIQQQAKTCDAGIEGVTTLGTCVNTPCQKCQVRLLLSGSMLLPLKLTSCL